MLTKVAVIDLDIIKVCRAEFIEVLLQHIVNEMLP